MSGGTKKNAQSEDDKKMLKDETVKVDKDKKRVKTRRHLQMAKKMIKKTTRKMPILKLKMLMGKQRIKIKEMKSNYTMIYLILETELQ